MPVVAGTLSANATHAAVVAGDRIFCFDLMTGNDLWQSPPVPRAERYPLRFTPTLVLHRDVVLFAGGEFAANKNRSWKVGKDDTVSAISMQDGSLLWEAPHPLSGYASSEDLFAIGDVVWYGETTSGHAVGKITGRELYTGKVVAEFDPDIETYWFHHRCYRSKATEKYMLTSRTGVEFIDLADQTWSIHHWVRGACLYGVMPANGLLYAPQHPCACFLEAKMYGFNALAPEGMNRPKRPDRVEDAQHRLQKGTAYGEPHAEEVSNREESWPTYRHDSARSGNASTRISSSPEVAWKSSLGGRLSSPIIAGGKVFLAAIDQHTLHGLDAQSGKPLWKFSAGGRIDSPPTFWQGRLYFGSADGEVYCLRAADGKLMWRFRTAPSEMQHMSFGQIESVWPVHGSVLIEKGILYFVSGRSIFLDGGLRLFRLDPKSGELLSETLMNEFDPQQKKMVQDFARQHNMPVGLPDILSSDGRYVYMRSQPFELDGTRLPLEALPYAGNPERYSIPVTLNWDHAHLFCPSGFLDDSWWHRTYWVYGSRFIGGWAGYSQAGKVAPSGKILVFDDSRVYGFGRLPKYYRWTTPIEHHLFSAVKNPTELDPARRKELSQPPKNFQVLHHWSREIDIFARAMVLADGKLYVAGPNDLVDEPLMIRSIEKEEVQARMARQAAVYRGAEGSRLLVVNAEDGEKLSEIDLKDLPIFDGMAAAGGCLYLVTKQGGVICLK
jgi:outer membrane protein assembly factor BamB